MEELVDEPRCRVVVLCSRPFPGGESSKMCRVDLSEVAATRVLLGDIPMEKMAAWSTPRRNSAMGVLLLVRKTRIRVP